MNFFIASCISIKLDKVFSEVLLLVLNFVGPDCKRYSLNNNGPCINGGNLTCRGNEFVVQITCECPPHYHGMFCEEKEENVNQNFFFNTTALLN